MPIPGQAFRSGIGFGDPGAGTHDANPFERAEPRQRPRR
jgi:hypothetical protein